MIICLAGMYAVLSALFGHVFAKLHVDLPVVKLPLFIGEVVFFICALIFFLLLENKKKWLSSVSKSWGLLVFYILTMIALTSQQWFGLSLRNAAMLYYAFFALFIFTALNICRFNELGLRMLFGISVLVCFFISPDSYFRYSFIVLCLFALLRMQKSRTRLMLVLLLVVCSHPDNLFAGARTSLVSALAALLFLISASVGYLLPLPLRWRLTGFCFCIVLVLGVSWFKGDHNGIMSILSPQGVIERYNKVNQQIKQSKYVPQPLMAKMYNPYAYGTSDVNSGKVDASVRVADNPPDVSKETAGNLPSRDQNTPSHLSLPSPNNEEEGDQYRSLAVAYNNMLFRILIWRDMIAEVWHKKAWLGLGFGYPQRSMSIEAMDWASIEWRRDGWITPHNLFLHLVYRCGVVGIILIVLLVGWVWRKSALFLRVRCYEGVLLISALIYWLVAAQILVVLELPYYAIPFWLMVGLTWYTADELESKAVDFSKGGR